MFYKDLLVAVDNSELSEQAFSVALKLSHQFKAHLTALYPIRTLADLPLVGMAEGSGVLARYRDSLYEESAVCRERYARLAENGLVRMDWQQPEGNPDDLIADVGRLSDLVILAQGDQQAHQGAIKGLSDDVLLRLGRPALVVPYTGLSNTEFKRVLIAWDGSQPATRAIHDAFPILRNASVVEVVCIEDSARQAKPLNTETLHTHLLRHSINSEITRLPRGEINTGSTLLNHAADTGADILVVGAYGHSRLRETIFGGVTSMLLKSMTLPLLMSH